jgi:sugar/nucleoside kinase (ribokinase family)
MVAKLAPAVGKRIVAMRAAGASFDSIAVLLNRSGLCGCSGGRWFGASVRRYLLQAGVNDAFKNSTLRSPQ